MHRERSVSRRLQRRLLRVHGDGGQAALEHMAVLAVVTVVIAAVIVAFTANSPLIGERTSYLVCRVLTLGTGGCGGGPPSAQDRQPTGPCVVGTQGDLIALGAEIAFVKVGGNRAFQWEELSDGRFRVTQTSGGDVGATAGVGASTSFTFADNRVGVGASAGVSGGVTFKGGPEWIVDSREELERLISAENWDRFDSVVGAANPILGAVGPLRRALGIGESFPPPKRVFVATGATAKASAYAGAGAAVATAGVEGSSLLGFSYEPEGNGEKTFYFETTVKGEAFAGVAGGADSVGARLKGKSTVLTSVTVDADGNVVRVKRSGLATGQSAGLTNALFGGDLTGVTTDKLGTGTQFDATLDVRTDADRRAVLALLASTGINPRGIGVNLDGSGSLLNDPLGNEFMQAVRDRGELTRYQVQADDTVWFEGAGEVAAGAKLSLNGGYTRTSMTAGNHEYWDGTRFAPRTNC
jgi:hypothetical protein